MVPTSKSYSDSLCIRISGVRAPKVLEDYFGSHMVDVAYLTEIQGTTVKVVTEGDVNLGDLPSREWILELVQGALNSCGESEANMEVIIDA